MKRSKKAIVPLLGVLAAEGVIVFLLTCAWTGAIMSGENTAAMTPSATPDRQDRTISTPETALVDNTAVSSAEKKEIKKIYKTDKKTLALVNKKKKLKTSYHSSLIPICQGRLQASEYLYDSLVRMLADAGDEGYQYFIASAYRSREKQQALINDGVRKRMRHGASYDEAIEKTYEEIMPAGHSEHETGLALDILCSGNMHMDVSQKEEPGNRWLRKHCYKYGFILRYPKGKEHITNTTYEPWHFRYVGERAAKYMREQNLTLEEFWDGME